MTPRSAVPESAPIEAERKEWMGVLARAPIDLLRAAFDGCRERERARWLVEPEIGLLQLRAKAPVTGTPFHLGEATITRCVVDVDGRRGYAVVLGRDPERAEIAAVFDALLQEPQLRACLAQELLQPAKVAIGERRRSKADAAQATAAHFFTAAREGGAP
ncbi:MULTISPECIES: phosphonate C-P lyase system protein PhnG [unclassified Rhizobium]|uniref:phosphonate C-P lyase system protein PhnG n=1 Tax=unclassified Rhizobium TaxID=2613769 RepID=UPI001A9830AA|nr:MULTISPECIES: phosphonate C-P lyase system protein PhnG [unclassified Rhizobium]MBT9372568.1 phosphonate C-P lyase system protein PhnG [Rhizobium sp. CSW-27]